MILVRQEDLVWGHRISLCINSGQVVIVDTLACRFGHGATIAEAIADHRSRVADISVTDRYWHEQLSRAGDEGQNAYECAYAMFLRSEGAVAITKLLDMISVPIYRLLDWAVKRNHRRTS